MSAVEVTISGVLYDKQRRTTQNVVLIGEATLTGVGVGGGPVFPEGGGGGEGIWGPTDPRPTPPIHLPGGGWGGRPPQVGGGPIIPPEPTEPPPDGADKPPPEGAGGWGFVAEWSRWGYFPAEGDKPHPPSIPRPPGSPDQGLPPEPGAAPRRAR